MKPPRFPGVTLLVSLVAVLCAGCHTGAPVAEKARSFEQVVPDQAKYNAQRAASMGQMQRNTVLPGTDSAPAAGSK